jgi:hypothetical protein
MHHLPKSRRHQASTIPQKQVRPREPNQRGWLSQASSTLLLLRYPDETKDDANLPFSFNLRAEQDRLPTVSLPIEAVAVLLQANERCFERKTNQDHQALSSER